MPDPSRSILGCRVDRVALPEALSQIRAFLRSGSPHHLVTANTLMILEAQRDAELRTLIEQAALVIPESAGLLWASRRLGMPLEEFVPGIDLMMALCEVATTPSPVRRMGDHRSDASLDRPPLPVSGRKQGPSAKRSPFGRSCRWWPRFERSIGGGGGGDEGTSAPALTLASSAEAAASAAKAGHPLPPLAGEGISERSSIFLLGGRPGVAEEAAQELKNRFRELNVAGTHDGYFSSSAESAVIDRIRNAQPSFLFVGMGMPAQEKWIARNLQALRVPVVMGVGGSFDVLSGRLKRAPVWMRRRGIEWGYRLAQEPWRWKRIAQLSVFAWKVWRGKQHGK